MSEDATIESEDMATYVTDTGEGGILSVNDLNLAHDIGFDIMNDNVAMADLEVNHEEVNIENMAGPEVEHEENSPNDNVAMTNSNTETPKKSTFFN